MKEEEEVEELQEIARRLSAVSRGYVMASARAAEFGERAICEQYGLPLNKEPPKDAA
jgi:hypothetical protein